MPSAPRRCSPASSNSSPKPRRSRAPLQNLADRVAALLRARRRNCRRTRFSRLAPLRSGAGPRLRHRCRRLGAHHRLPLRAWPRHADIRHGGDRQRRARRHSRPQRRGTRNLRQGRYPRRGQDGHADRRQAEAHRYRLLRRRRTRSSGIGGEHRDRERTPDRRRHCCRRPREGPDVRAGAILHRRRRSGSPWASFRARRSPSAMPASSKR